jgi:hypothetical protein
VRVHWFANHIPNDVEVEDLRGFISFLNSCGYESVLFTYYNVMADMFIKLSHVLNKEEKIKFMIAIRTRAISPEYLSMLAYGFSQIQRDRLMFNILHGSLSPEETTEGIIEHDKVFSSKIGIFNHTEAFLDRLKKNVLFKKSGAKVLVSAGSSETAGLSEKYADYMITTFEMLKREHISKSKQKKIVVIDLVLEEPGENSFKFYSGVYPYDIDALKVLYPEDFLKFLKDLKKMGIEDVMLSGLREDPKQDRIHEFVKNNLDAIIAI